MKIKSKSKITVILIIVLALLGALAIIAGKIADKKKEDKSKLKPEVVQMRNICELATLECYYHNIAKYKEKDAEGILFWKKDKNFWVEYSGVVKVGIDVSKLDMVVEGKKVTITLPPAEILGSRVDDTDFNKDSIYVGKKSADVDAEDVTAALAAAQADMEQSAAENATLLMNARDRAQKLLEGYINNLGEQLGIEYEIEWIYLDGEESTGVEENNEVLPQTAG